MNSVFNIGDLLCALIFSSVLVPVILETTEVTVHLVFT